MFISLSTSLLKRVLLVSLLGGLWLGSAAVQANDNRWYQVEVVLFSHNSQSFRSSEQWPEDYTQPKQHAAVRLLPASAGQRQNFSMVESGNLQLAGEARRIQADGDLTLLSHQGWYQQGFSPEQARGVLINIPSDQAGPGAPPRLEGVLTLSLSRYLHINADLLYREARVNAPASGGEAQSLFHGREILGQGAWQVYRMEESRRMRSNELHYLDHPVFGVLVLITPL